LAIPVAAGNFFETFYDPQGLIPMLNPLPASEWTPQAAAHLLNRAAFGGTPDEIQKLHALGHPRAVESLLGAGEELDLFPPPEMEPMSIGAEKIKNLDLSPAEKNELQKAHRNLIKTNGEKLRYWWLRRMRETPNPTREKAVLFWHSHWATGIRKVKDPFLMHRQNETLRAHALGPFAQFAKQISRDPAMIHYLDLGSSSAAKPNENFAREVMELFLLGEGHYSETDISEAARAFTGYRVDRKTGSFRFQQRQADRGAKTVFGKTGPLTGDDVIDIIVSQPRCSEFIAGKIWNYYAGIGPSSSLRKTLGDQYHRSGMDTGKLLKTIFRSSEFYNSSVVRQQIKSPVQWLVQTCKILRIPVPERRFALPLLTNLGQTLFDPPNVKGWDGGRAWISSSTLLVRYNSAGQMIRSADSEIDRVVPPGRNDEQTADALAWTLFQGPMATPLRERTTALITKNGTTAAARRDLLHLLMSTPEYQLT
jgi:uncharacterized protein (DUF1800 family)